MYRPFPHFGSNSENCGSKIINLFSFHQKHSHMCTNMYFLFCNDEKNILVLGICRKCIFSPSFSRIKWGNLYGNTNKKIYDKCNEFISLQTQMKWTGEARHFMKSMSEGTTISV